MSIPTDTAESAGHTPSQPSGGRLLYFAANSCIVKSVDVESGSILTQTKTPPAECLFPRFSPDGKKFAAWGGGDNLRLYIANVDGSGLVWLPDGMNTGPFAWYPDGSKMVYWDSSKGLTVVNPDGSGGHPLGDWSAAWPWPGDPIAGLNPMEKLISWSPDGQWLYSAAFMNADQTRVLPVVFNANGSDFRILDAASDGNYVLGTWAPDSSRIVFSYSLPDGGVRTDILGLDNSRKSFRYFQLDIEPALPYDAYLLHPAWSPSGDRILAGLGLGGGYYYAIVVSTETGTGVVVNDQAAASDVPFYSIWSPDGNRIVLYEATAVDDFGNSTGYIVLMTIDGFTLSNRKQLAQQATLPIVWLPS
jgi:Tol biopolymer transport system component